jgi:hypothetical protein
MQTMNGAAPWLIILAAVLTYALVVTIGFIISQLRGEGEEDE